MTKLSRLLQERGIDFDPQDSRIMCFPHILNICSKHATDDLASADLTSVSEASFVFPGSNVNKRAYLEALGRDPIAHAHDVVHIVRSSSLRCESFKEIILDGNIKKYWRDEECEVVQLPVRELICNVPTHWDSKYAMAQRLRLYRQVRRDSRLEMITHAMNLILQQVIWWFFESPVHQDITLWKLVEADWLVLEDLEMVLEVLCACPNVFLHTNLFYDLS